ncbi:BTB/POZ protein [Pavlovales sp. CCMP2436]|nr:BTB/POZ protein [Pavlovales sp. CCMP2436]
MDTSCAGTQTSVCTDAADDGSRELTPIDDSVDLLYLAAQARRISNYQSQAMLTDVIVRVDGHSFPCHRLQLCASSAFFRALFASSMRDAGSDVELLELEAATFSSVLAYIYSGQSTLTPHTVVAILAAADRLAIIELREHCTRFLQRNLTAENALGAHAVASTLSLARLRESALRVALEQFDEVRAQEGFVECSSDFLSRLYGSDELRAKEENVVDSLGM